MLGQPHKTGLAFNFAFLGLLSARMSPWGDENLQGLWGRGRTVRKGGE